MCVCDREKEQERAALAAEGKSLFFDLSQAQTQPEKETETKTEAKSESKTQRQTQTETKAQKQTQRRVEVLSVDPKQRGWAGGGHSSRENVFFFSVPSLSAVDALSLSPAQPQMNGDAHTKTQTETKTESSERLFDFTVAEDGSVSVSLHGITLTPRVASVAVSACGDEQKQAAQAKTEKKREKRGKPKQPDSKTETKAVRQTDAQKDKDRELKGATVQVWCAGHGGKSSFGKVLLTITHTLKLVMTVGEWSPEMLTHEVSNRFKKATDAMPAFASAPLLYELPPAVVAQLDSAIRSHTTTSSTKKPVAAVELRFESGKHGIVIFKVSLLLKW